MQIKILFAFTGEPQNLINQIHFNTFGGSSYPGKLIIRYLFFCLPMAGEGGRGQSYSCESLVEVVYVKWPNLFSAFNMMSDWIRWFSFTEGVRGFCCWFLMMIFMDLLAFFLLSFATTMASQNQGLPGFLGIRYTGAFKIWYTVYCSLNTGMRYVTFFEFQV